MEKMCQQHGRVECDVVIANTDMKMIPGTTCLVRGMMYVKECLVNIYERVSHRSKWTQKRLGSISMRIQLESANIFLLSAHNQAFRSIKMAFLNSKIEYQQIQLTLGRQWLDKKLHGEMNSKIFVTTDDVSIYLTGMFLRIIAATFDHIISYVMCPCR
jgi:hypothetical protein